MRAADYRIGQVSVTKVERQDDEVGFELLRVAKDLAWERSGVGGVHPQIHAGERPLRFVEDLGHVRHLRRSAVPGRR